MMATGESSITNGRRRKAIASPNDAIAALTRFGFGAAPIGNLYREVDEDEALCALETAWAAGIRYFDTAPHYGFGLSEERLGRFLRLHNRETFSVSTKVGRILAPLEGGVIAGERHGFVNARPFEPVFDYTYDGIMRSFDSSLKRLGLSKIDILFAHDLGRVTHGDAHGAFWRDFKTGGYRAMTKLRDEGSVAAIGIGANEWAVCHDALQEFDMDCFLLAGRYTLLEQAPLEIFLPACAEKGVAVIVGGAFNSGILVTGPTDGSRYNYEQAPEAIRRRVEKLAKIAAAFETPLPAAALAFPLFHESVASVVVGLANKAEARRLAEWSTAQIPEAFWRCLQEEGLLDPLAPAGDGALV